MSAYFHFCLAF